MYYVSWITSNDIIFISRIVNIHECKQVIKWGTNMLIRFRARPTYTYLEDKKVRVSAVNRTV